MGWDNESLKNRNLITTGFHLPYNPTLLDSARTLRKNMTAAERMLWQGFFKKFKYRVLRQRPIDNFIVDFYCPKMELVIEIDGSAHFTEEGKELDKERTGILKAYGVRVIRFSNQDVLEHFSEICETINSMDSVHNTAS
jgi:very-short-patch-repair endonuclease